MAMNYLDAKFSPLEKGRTSLAKRILDIFVKRGD